MTKRQFLEKIPFKLLAVFLLLAAGISAGGYFYYLNQRTRAVTHIKTDLATIAQLKSGQIEAWRRERYGDAYVLAESKIFAAYVSRWFANPKDNELKQNIYKRLNAFRIYDPYKEVLLVDLSGRTRIFMGPGESHDISQATKALINQSLESNKVVFSDFYYCEKCREVHLDLIAPLSDGPSPIGILVLRINPEKYLFPLIQSWPTISRSGETVLVRKEGNEIVYLNELRHQKDTALKLRLPLTDTLLPASMAALGKEGMVEGIDYRDVPVAAYVKHIPDSPWYLVAKVDKDEIYAPLKQQALSIILVIGLILILLALGLGLLWQGERRGFYKRQYQQELEKRALIRHYDYLTMYANDIILLSDEKYNLIEVNDRACQAYGYRREELLKMKASALRAGETKPQFKDQVEDMVRQGGMVYETVHKRKDGSTFPVESSARPIEIEGKKYIQGIIRDISERKQHELIIQERNQILGTANRSLDILYRCSLELASLPAGKPVHEVLTGCLKELTGGVAVSFGEYDRAAKELIVKQILMEENLLSKVGNILGKPLIDVHSPVSSKTYDIMMSEGVGVRYTLNEITFGAVPKLVSASVGAMMGIDRYLAIVYQTEGQLYGTSVAALKKGQPEPDPVILKAFGSLGAVSLRRAQAEANLQTSHEELQASYQEIEANNEELMAAEEELRNNLEELAESHAALRESDSKLQLTLHEASIGIASVGLNKHFLNCNKAFCEFIGYSEEELQQKTITDITYPEDAEIGLADLRAIAAGQMKTSLVEKRYVRKDGAVVWGEVRINLLRNDNGQPLYFLPVIQDITERKRSAEELKKSQEQLKNANELAHIGSWSWAIETDTVVWTEELYRIAGRDPKLPAPTYAEHSNIYNPESWARLKTAVGKAMSTGEGYQMELELIRPDGTTRWVNAFGGATKDGRGNIIGLFGTVQDITERKLAEEALKKNEEAKTKLLENLNAAQHIALIGSWEWDVKTDKVWWSDETYQIFGVTPQGYTPSFEKNGEFIHPDDLEIYKQSFARSLKTGKPLDVDIRLIAKDGVLKQCSASGKIIQDDDGRPFRFIGTIMDITKRKRIDETLLETSRRLELALTISNAGTWDWDVLTGTIIWSPEMYRLFELDPQKTTASFESWRMKLHPEDVQIAESRIEKALKEKTRLNSDYRVLLENGQIRWINATGEGVYDEKGQPTQMLGICLDITERKEAEAKIVENEQKFRQLAENIDMVFWLTDWTEKKLLYVNQAYEKVFGLTVESAYSDRMGWKTTVHPDDLERVSGDLLSHAGREEFTELEYRIICQGKIKWIHEQAFPLKDEAGKVIRFINVADDITERKQAEEHIQKQMAELQRWQGTMLDREDRVLELKREVNEILARQGQPKKYGSG